MPGKFGTVFMKKTASSRCFGGQVHEPEGADFCREAEMDPHPPVFAPVPVPGWDPPGTSHVAVPKEDT